MLTLFCVDPIKVTLGGIKRFHPEFILRNSAKSHLHKIINGSDKADGNRDAAGSRLKPVIPIQNINYSSSRIFSREALSLFALA